MVTLQPSLTENFTEGLHTDESKDCNSGLEYVTVNNGFWIFKCSECNKSYEKEFD